MLPGAKQFAQLYQSHAKGAKGTDRIMAGQNHGDFTGANRDNRDINRWAGRRPILQDEFRTSELFCFCTRNFAKNTRLFPIAVRRKIVRNRKARRPMEETQIYNVLAETVI